MHATQVTVAHVKSVVDRAQQTHHPRKNRVPAASCREHVHPGVCSRGRRIGTIEAVERDDGHLNILNSEFQVVPWYNLKKGFDTDGVTHVT